jgi:dolichol-phosphate mannosyltransferase
VTHHHCEDARATRLRTAALWKRVDDRCVHWEGMPMPSSSHLVADGPQPVPAVDRALPTIVVIIPTYFEAGTIGRVVAGVQAGVPNAVVLVVDDASGDGTAAVATRSALDPDRFAVLGRPAKLGLGSAYRDGFEWAIARRAAVVATLDADLSHDPADLPRLLAALDAGADLAVGSRFVPGGSTPGLGAARRLISLAANRLSRGALGLGVRDSTSGFRAYRLSPMMVEVVRASTSWGFSIEVELLQRVVRAGGGVVECPIEFAGRAGGRSKFSAAIFAEAAWNVLRWTAVRLVHERRARRRLCPRAGPSRAELVPRTRTSRPRRRSVAAGAAPVGPVAPPTGAPAQAQPKTFAAFQVSTYSTMLALWPSRQV